MNVLLIAPDHGLDLINEEVRAVSAILRPVILNGYVTIKDVIEHIKGQDWDLIWFATHGNEQGISLSDGHIKTPDLIAIIRESGAKTVFINTCSSIYIGLELHYELGIIVVATESDINDQTAYQTGILFARALVETNDPIEAFNRSKPGRNGNYKIFYNPKLLESTETKNILMINEMGNRLNGKIEIMQEKIENEIKKIHEDIDILSHRIEKNIEFPFWHRVALFVSILLLFFPVLLFHQNIQNILDVSWQTSLKFSIFSYFVNFVLWFYILSGGNNK